MSTIKFPDKTTGSASTAAANDQSFTYNNLGEKLNFVDQNGTTHSYTYDVLGRLQYDSITVASGNPQGVNTAVQSLGYTYDTGGRPYQQSSYSGTSGTGTLLNQVTDSYNGLGQLTSEQQYHGSGFGTGTVQYAYTAMNNGAENNSRLRSVTYPNGRIVDYDYAPTQEPVTGIAFSGSTATVTTAKAHNLSAGDTVVIEGVTNQTLYDGTFTILSNPAPTATTFSYTMSGTPTAAASGTDMTEAKLTLDNAISRLDGFQDHSTSGAAIAGTVLEGYSYLGLSTVVQKTRAQPNVNLSYIQQSGDTLSSSDGGDRYTGLDRHGRVIDQYWTNPSTPTTPTDRFQYWYDRYGNVLYQQVLQQNSTGLSYSEIFHTSGGLDSSAYDGLNRLLTYVRGTLSHTNSGNLDPSGRGLPDTVATQTASNQYNMDPLGNWTSTTSQTRTFYANNQIKTISGLTTPTYDNNGNMTKDQQGYTYSFDAWNRMVLANNGHHEVFAYDADNRRPSVSSCCPSSFSDSYYSSQWQDLEDDTTTNTGCTCTVTHSTYAWSITYIDDLIERDSDSGMARVYAQQDMNHDVTALIGVTGSVLERFVYDPYGNVSVLTSAWVSTSDSQNWVYRFQGGRFDGLTGLYNFRSRDYNPTLGTWVEADIGYLNGANLYQFVSSNPTRFTDPSGNWAWNATLWGVAVGAGSLLEQILAENVFGPIDEATHQHTQIHGETNCCGNMGATLKKAVYHKTWFRSYWGGGAGVGTLGGSLLGKEVGTIQNDEELYYECSSCQDMQVLSDTGWKRDAGFPKTINKSFNLFGSGVVTKTDTTTVYSDSRTVTYYCADQWDR